jgi:hypothetical protein
MKNKRYIPTLATDGHHVSCYILRDKISGRFVSLRFGSYANKQWNALQSEVSKGEK